FAMEVMRSRLYELNGNERPLQIAFRASTVVDYRNPRGGDGRGSALGPPEPLWRHRLPRPDGVHRLARQKPELRR
ncbi:MAG: hypothetical protein LBD04_03245, partial [Synergistaceae bacterium]|nr:hypothetical protein [Synergistaceae bacterium]